MLQVQSFWNGWWSKKDNDHEPVKKKNDGEEEPESVDLATKKNQ